MQLLHLILNKNLPWQKHCMQKKSVENMACTELHHDHSIKKWIQR